MSSETRLSAETVVVFGKIVGAYGVKGWVKIHPFADDPLSWQQVKLWLRRPESDSLAAWAPIPRLQMRVHGDGLVAKIDDVVDRNGAEALVGNLLAAPREALPKAAEDEYYWGDLLGLSVVNDQGLALGTVRELMETGANSVLVVVDAEGNERLLPFVASVVKRVDVERHEITVEWGLDW